MSKRLSKDKQYVLEALRHLAEHCQAFRGTLYDFQVTYLPWIEYPRVASSIKELIDEGKILYIKEDDVYTLIISENEM